MPGAFSISLRRVAMGACLLTVLGCSSSDGRIEPAPVNSESTCSIEERAACRVDQKGCALVDEESSCVTCEPGHHAAISGLCERIGGSKLSHAFPETTTPSGEEILGQCRSWTLNNEEEIWVNAVELQQTEMSHHSNWMFAPDHEFDGPDGIWPCKDRKYSQLAAALSGGVLYAQSTQATHEVQKFPNGVVVRIPPRSRIISDIHTLNTTADEVVGHATLTLYTLTPEEVKVRLAPFHVTYDELDIPPKSESRFHGECEIASHFESNVGTAVEAKVHYLLPHTHALGTRMFVEAYGGPQGDVPLIDVRGFNGEARGRNYEPAIDISGSKGIRFGCEFTNPRDESVKWGFDDQEMCEALGFIESPVGFESRISEVLEDGEDRGILKFTGSCVTAAFPWDQNKPGGMGN